MVGEPTDTTYSDGELAEIIESYPLLDGLGREPQIESDDDPSVLETNPDWDPTYDLNASAAEIWSEKAAALSDRYDFQAGGQSFQRSQAWEQAIKMSNYYRARRSAKTITLQMVPKPDDSEDTTN